VKYVLMFVETEQFAKELEEMAPAEREQTYHRVEQWLADHADVLRGGAKLKGPNTATTVRLDGSGPVTTDGPFIEGKEVISGFSMLEAEDLDEVLRIVKDWPGCPIVEIRPVEL
jgi:hypothetical protein